MKLTDYEKEVIAMALDHYAALLIRGGQSETAYSLKTARELRDAFAASITNHEKTNGL